MPENKLPKISYLFGAGASAQALPTIKQLPERIKFVRDFINTECVYEETETFSPTPNHTFKKNDAKQYVLEGLDKLFVQSSNHSTVDTYAKKLNISGNSHEINELIFFLALYFNIEQKISGLDSRYDTFLVSILNSNSYSFPDNLKFLSWNYDLQMEAAHEKIINRGSHDLSFYLFNSERSDLTKNKFTSIKLNGSSNFLGRFRDLFPLVKNILTDSFLKEDLDFPLQYAFLHVKQRLRVYEGSINLNFAWYHDNELVNKIIENYNETDILVVVGYSFPFFNREVDRKIIRAMTNLKKIYIQDCVPENIKSRFLSILPDWKERKIEIISVDDISEFFLPPEL
jgi:hypothetical protein